MFWLTIPTSLLQIMIIMKNDILKTIEKIHQAARKSKLNDQKFVDYASELNQLKEYFKLQDENPVLLATIIAQTCFESQDINTVVKYLGFEEISMLSYMKDIESFINKNILLSKKDLFEQIYWVNPLIKRYIVEGMTLTEEILTPQKRECSLITCLAEMLTIPKSDLYEKMLFEDKFWKLLDDYKEVSIIKYIIDHFDEQIIDAYIFLDTINDAISAYNNDYNTELQSTLNDCSFERYDSLKYMSRFKEGDCIVKKLNLIDSKPSIFRGDHKLKLSDKALALLKELEGIELGGVNLKKMTNPTEIKPVELFYNPFEASQLATIEKSISEENFENIQSNLAKNNMPIGVTVVLFGTPGTGKTETVYQIAKRTGRPIFKVDISNTKSSWFGESEKIIKKVFTDYQKAKKQSRVCPILLLNEADAILGKRVENNTSDVANTENAIQNILLEELENFEGILFATTNLVGNLDHAFERRFLFKVKIDQPNVENAKKIWKNKLQFITENEAHFLAENFPFSGGEMQNIARKALLNAVIYNQPIEFDQIVEYCQNEKWQSNKKAIGF